MAQGKTLLLPGLALFIIFIALLPESSGDRSPYVPDPVTYPGLLPQFTSTTVRPPGAGQQQPQQQKPKPSTTTTEAASEVPETEGNNLGDRFGEENSENRPDGSEGSSGGNRPGPQRPQTQRPQTQRPLPQRPCNDQVSTPVPCYDCIVYISRTGTITRFYPRQSGGF